MNIRNQISFLSILLLTSLLVTHLSYANTIYPENPNKTQNAIYVSSSGVTAFNVDTLETKWCSLNGIHTFEPVVTHSFLLVGSSAGLHAIDLSSGNTIWAVENSLTIFTPIIENGIAYAGSEEGLLLAINVDTGKILWRKKMDGWIYTPIVYENILLAGGSSHNLYGIDKNNGKTIWQEKIQQELVYRPVVALDNSAIVTTFDGMVLKIRIQDGKTLWSIKDQVLNMSPVFINHTLLISTLDGRIKNLDIDNGNMIWEYDIGGQPQIALSSVNNVIAISDNQGKVIGMNINKGDFLWQTNYEGEMIGRPFLHRNEFLMFQSARYYKNFDTNNIEPRKIR